ncbi:uncharacterized protein LOC134783360 [Penaeus indicus]|uniref:uncharacterized protein LOC134783360 n=1 Tax=Penaeus indicus TaxID=29960 RepID=UPI00300CA3EC
MNSSTISTGYGPRYKPFDGNADNYDLWEENFHGVLYVMKLHHAFDRYASERPDGYNLEDAKKTIYSYLTGYLDITSLGMIKREARDDGVKALAVLRKYYMRETNHRLNALWRTFINKRLEEGSVTQYLSSMEETVAALRESGESVSDRLIVATTLKGLPPKYKNFVDVANQRDPSYDYPGLKTALFSHEDHLKENSDTERVMVTQGNSTANQKRCFKCGEPGHFASKCNKGGEFKRVNKYQNNKKWCELHRSRTHNTSECRTKNPRKNNNSVNSANDTSEDNHEYYFHITHSSRLRPVEGTSELCDIGKQNISSLEADENLLMIDSGCTSHIEENEPKFVRFQEYFDPQNHYIELV